MYTSIKSLLVGPAIIDSTVVSVLYLSDHDTLVINSLGVAIPLTNAWSTLCITSTTTITSTE